MGLAVRVYEKEVAVFVVTVSGSLDSATYQDLEKKMTPFLMESTKALILDLKGLEYISSMGVSAVLKAKKIINDFGGNFMMVNLRPQIKTVFDIIKALPDVPIFANLEEADRYLSEMQKRTLEKQ